MPQGVCKLCLGTKALQESHLFPRNLYKALRNHDGGNPNPAPMTWRKLVGVEPTRDTKCRTTGFEDQAQHRPRLASSRDSNTQLFAHHATGR
jgi:hypothetical protein